MKNNSCKSSPNNSARAARFSITVRLPRLISRGLVGAFLSLALAVALAAQAADITVTNTPGRKIGRRLFFSPGEASAPFR